jgi:ribosomal protein S18 acetylase RimI-like enzyme
LRSEKLTSGTYNLLAIGVSEHYQRKGIAKEMMSYIEQELRGKDGRLLIVETSSDAAQAGARKLYQKIGSHRKLLSEISGMTVKTKLCFGKSCNPKI